MNEEAFNAGMLIARRYFISHLKFILPSWRDVQKHLSGKRIKPDYLHADYVVLINKSPRVGCNLRMHWGADVDPYDKPYATFEIYNPYSWHKDIGINISFNKHVHRNENILIGDIATRSLDAYAAQDRAFAEKLEVHGIVKLYGKKIASTIINL